MALKQWGRLWSKIQWEPSPYWQELMRARTKALRLARGMMYILYEDQGHCLLFWFGGSAEAYGTIDLRRPGPL